MRRPFQLESTYVHLGDGGEAFQVEVDEQFWPELMADKLDREGVRRFARDPGWMLASFRMEQDMPHWELHPEGDEILHLLSGELLLILQRGDEEQHVRLRRGETFVMPKGVWHRQEVVQPADLLAITYGRGSQHKPR